LSFDIMSFFLLIIEITKPDCLESLFTKPHRDNLAGFHKQAVPLSGVLFAGD
jgi:hypothetical protein